MNSNQNLIFFSSFLIQTRFNKFYALLVLNKLNFFCFREGGMRETYVCEVLKNFRVEQNLKERRKLFVLQFEKFLMATKKNNNKS